MVHKSGFVEYNGAVVSRLPTATLLCVMTIAHDAPALADSPVEHQDPRWQVSAIPTYCMLVAYDGKNRRGAGVDVGLMFQLTTALSLQAQAGFVMTAPGKKDISASQGIRMALMLRYDLDVIAFRPFLAAGGMVALFTSGTMKDAQDASSPAGVAVGADFGPQIEAGFDWRPVRYLVVGVVLDMAWLMRFVPADRKHWPSLRTAGVRVGVYF